MIYTNNIFSKQSARPQTVQNISYNGTNESFDTYMVESLIHLNEFYFNISMEHTQVMNVGMLDDNVEILHEGFSDFMKNVAEFFKRLINSIVEFFKKAAAYLSSFFVDFDKFIKKHKDLIDKANPDFDIEGYEYTFEKSVPDIGILKDLINECNSDLSKLDKMTKEEVGKLRTEYMTTDNLNEMRGKVLGIRGSVTQDEYLETAKKIYRDDATDKKTIHIDKSKLNKAVSEYSELKSTFNEVQKQKNDTIRLLNDVKNFFERSARVQYSGKNKVIATNNIELGDNKINRGEKVEYSHSHDSLEVVNTYFKFRFEQSKTISVMVTNAFNEKVKALKECLHMQRAIIRKSIFSKTEKEDVKESFVMEEFEVKVTDTLEPVSEGVVSNIFKSLYYISDNKEEKFGGSHVFTKDTKQALSWYMEHESGIKYREVKDNDYSSWFEKTKEVIVNSKYSNKLNKKVYLYKVNASAFDSNTKYGARIKDQDKFKVLDVKETTLTDLFKSVGIKLNASTVDAGDMAKRNKIVSTIRSKFPAVLNKSEYKKLKDTKAIKLDIVSADVNDFVNGDSDELTFMQYDLNKFYNGKARYYIDDDGGKEYNKLFNSFLKELMDNKELSSVRTRNDGDWDDGTYSIVIKGGDK